MSRAHAIHTGVFRTETAKKTWPIFSWQSFALGLLIVSSLLTAFGIIYLKDLNRRLFIEYQNLQQVQQQYQTEWGKLLLEESTWSAQSHVQQQAQQHLGMLMPNSKKIVIIDTPDTILASK